MATDAPGVHSVMKSIEKAKKQGTSIVDDGMALTYNATRTKTRGDQHPLFSLATTTTPKTVCRLNGKHYDRDVAPALYHFTAYDHRAGRTASTNAWAKNDEVPIRHRQRRPPKRGEEEGNIYDHFGVESLADAPKATISAADG